MCFVHNIVCGKTISRRLPSFHRLPNQRGETDGLGPRMATDSLHFYLYFFFIRLWRTITNDRCHVAVLIAGILFNGVAHTDNSHACDSFFLLQQHLECVTVTFRCWMYHGMGLVCARRPRRPNEAIGGGNTGLSAQCCIYDFDSKLKVGTHPN